jgi:hypothetical protein
MSIIDLEHINPGWNSGCEEYKINCINCAVATDAFLCGFRFEAKPAFKHKEILDIYNFYNDELTGSADYSSFSEILDKINTLQERGFLVISPNPDSFDYNSSYVLKIKSTHIVNIVLIGEIFYILDGQRNLAFQAVSPPPNYLPDTASYYFLSIDTNDNSCFSDREKVGNFCLLPEDISS